MEAEKQEAQSEQQAVQSEQQEEKKESVFREKSLERISEPEQLHDYIRVTSPGVWLVLLAVIVLLCGVVVWGIFGKLTLHDAKGAEKEIAPITLVTN
ncbi:MAG: hypothetical protein IJJ13_03260 [Lachnospiraceae bacterium]|nr:hypothetical protein [Lachnospiraceae bacterium]